MNIALLVLSCVGGAMLTAFGILSVLIAVAHCVLESRRRREAAAMIESGKFGAAQWELFTKGYITRTCEHKENPQSGD